MALSRDQIFAAHDLAAEEVPAPEWGEGETVRVRAFSLEARDAFWRPMREFIDTMEARVKALEDDGRGDEAAALRAAETARVVREIDPARLAVFTVVDGAGELVFGEEDIPRLRRKNPAVLERIEAVAMRLNGLSRKAREEARKN